MITSIEPFIELGWYTVPLQGELRRLQTGKKTLPMFEENWNAKYAKARNLNATKLGGVLTGEKSNIIAIDCDDTATYNLFKSLDPEYDFHFISKGKKDKLGNEVDAGIIVYEYIDTLEESFRLNTENIRLDFYSNNGFIYLPTQANTTKEPFELTDIKPVPTNILTLLTALKSSKPIQADSANLVAKTYSNFLAPQLIKFVRDKKLFPALFKILTPKDFRDSESYIDNGYLYPDEVPEGRGSEYLSKVSAILGADKSVDPDLYVDTMELINSFFSEPMLRSRLSMTIIEPMVEEKATINGVPIWQYDEDWQEGKLQLITKKNELLDAFYDPNRQRYYLVDTLRESASSWERIDLFMSHIETISIDAPSKKETKNIIPLVSATSTPAHEFGFYSNDDETAFNTFSPPMPLVIFKNPDSYKEKYSRPMVTLQFFESLVPDNYMRNYLLRFIRRKLDKFEYSPVYLYFLGKPGAGKDTLVSLLEKFVGEDGMSRPSVKQFLEIYNEWILDKYFVQLDEYGNQLVKFDDKELAVGYIKAYTGKPSVRVRKMRTDGFQYNHSMTFILTANKNPLFVEGDDRRMALFNTPNKLADEQWVQSYGGMTNVYEQIMREINDFAYYLSTEVDNLSRDEYMEPPNTADKKRLIASKFGAAQRIAFLLQHKMFDELKELCDEFEAEKVFSYSADGRVYEDDLFDLYYEMTEGNGTKRGLGIHMKEFAKIPTTSGGKKAYYFDIPGFRQYATKRNE